MTYYGPKGRSALKPDTSKYKKDIDIVRENHKFLWEDEEGEEVDTKNLKWEQRIAKKYWDKLFKEYAITDLTQFKSKEKLIESDHFSQSCFFLGYPDANKVQIKKI